MELPKHTTQVGTISANKKLYIEDYCISYLKQLTKDFPQDKKQIALYGTLLKEKGIEYAFIFGAALLGRGKGRTDSLTQPQKEEAEAYRQEYFEDYQLLGLVLSQDIMTENVYWIGNGNKSIALDGYFIFYDKNEAMLNFMMHDQQEERAVDMDPVIVKKADMDREKERRAAELAKAEKVDGKYRKQMQQEQRKSTRAEPQIKGGKSSKGKKLFPVAACFMVLAIGGTYGVKNDYISLDKAVTYVSELWGEGSVFANGENNVLETTLLEATDTTETTETALAVNGEGTLVVVDQVSVPGQMDTVVIPDLENVEESMETAAQATENQSNTLASEVTETPAAESVTAPVVENQSTGESYLIQRGDNLLHILRRYYGDDSKLQEICDLNGIENPDNIQVGQTIVLP